MPDASSTLSQLLFCQMDDGRTLLDVPLENEMVCALTTAEVKIVEDAMK